MQPVMYLLCDTEIGRFDYLVPADLKGMLASIYPKFVYADIGELAMLIRFFISKTLLLL
jgi:hypothetical protein